MRFPWLPHVARQRYLFGADETSCLITVENYCHVGGAVHGRIHLWRWWCRPEFAFGGDFAVCGFLDHFGEHRPHDRVNAVGGVQLEIVSVVSAAIAEVPDVAASSAAAGKLFCYFMVSQGVSGCLHTADFGWLRHLSPH